MSHLLERACCTSAMMLLTAAAVAGPNACSVASGATVPTVVELYTSEGCDSCPPADRWFSALKPEAARGRVLPLAFHVDYWDYLGWKDRFADPAFGSRHRAQASRGGARVVYTPQVLVDGREFLQWRKPRSDKLPPSGAPKPAGAALALAVSPAPSAPPSASKLAVTLSGTTAKPGEAAEAYVALFENELSSDVKAGENKGVRLRHDFVVRRWSGPYAFERGQLSVSQPIDVPADAELANSGVAVVALDGRGAVLQALALSLRDCAR